MPPAHVNSKTEFFEKSLQVYRLTYRMRLERISPSNFMAHRGSRSQRFSIWVRPEFLSEGSGTLREEHQGWIRNHIPVKEEPTLNRI